MVHYDIKKKLKVYKFPFLEIGVGSNLQSWEITRTSTQYRDM